jgi:hypothetical protein
MNTTAEAAPPTTLEGTRFGAHLLQLVGEPFLFVRRSYGDELVLHFGERAVGAPRKAKHGEFRYEHGTFSLHLRGSAWVIKSGQAPAVISGGLEEEFSKALGEPLLPANVETEQTITPGARVTAVIPFRVERPPVNGIGVRVDLSDGSSLVVVPTPEESPEPAPAGTTLYEIADWELHTPHGTLQVGPGLKWHFTPSSNHSTPHTDSEIRA